MSAGAGMTTSFDLPGAFQELFGNLRGSIKEINSELKKTREEAKRVFKETGQRDAALEQRIRTLSGDKERLQRLQKAKTIAQTEGRAKVKRAQDIARLARGGVTGDDVTRLTELVSTNLIQRGAAGSLTRRAGIALGQAPGQISGILAAAAPVAIVGGTAAFITKKVIDFFVQDNRRRQVAAQGDIQFQNELFRTFAGQGLSGSLSAQEMMEIRKNAIASGKQAASVIQNATFTGRMLRKFGFTQTEAASTFETRNQLREKNRRILARVNPNAAERATRSAVKANYGGAIEKRLFAENTTAMVARKMAESASVPEIMLNPALLGAWLYDQYSSGHIEAERLRLEEEYMDKEAATPSKSRQGQINHYLTKPQFALNRALSHESRRQVRAVEMDRRSRFNDWNPF